MKIHYYYILCWRLGPWGGRRGGGGACGGGYTSLCLGDLYHQLGKGYARILEEEEEEWSRGLG